MTWLAALAMVLAVLLGRAGRDDRFAVLAPETTESGLAAGAGSGPGASRAVRAGARWRPRRRRRERIAADERALEACGVLAEELRAGRDPRSALECAASVCPELAAVVTAHDLGADVPAALRRTDVPALHRVAGAWQVSARSGRGLAETVRAVADDLRADRATRRVVTSELASARSTARLLVALPVVALLVGSGGGSSPWLFFVSSLAGVACGVIGVLLLAGGLVWIERIADAVQAHT